MEQSLPWDLLPKGLLCADHTSKAGGYCRHCGWCECLQGRIKRYLNIDKEEAGIQKGRSRLSLPPVCIKAGPLLARVEHVLNEGDTLPARTKLCNVTDERCIYIVIKNACSSAARVVRGWDSHADLSRMSRWSACLLRASNYSLTPSLPLGTEAVQRRRRQYSGVGGCMHM